MTSRAKYAFLTSDKQFSGVPYMGKWQYVEWTPEAVSSYGIIFFIFFGSCALFVQGRKIWKNKSGLSVSATWSFIFFFMFLTYPIIGVERQNNLIVWQGVFRVLFYIPILIGLYKFKGFTKKEMMFGRILFMMIFIMVEYPSTGEFIYSIINLFGVIGVFLQGALIKKEQKTGVVSSVLLFAYATNVLFWMWYTYQIKDFFLFINSALFLSAYVYTIIMWIKFCRLEMA